MNLIKKKIRWYAKEVEDRNKRPEIEKGKVMQNLLEMKEFSELWLMSYNMILYWIHLARHVTSPKGSHLLFLHLPFTFRNKAIQLQQDAWTWTPQDFFLGKKKNHTHLTWHKHESTLMPLPFFFVLLCVLLIKSEDIET